MYLLPGLDGTGALFKPFLDAATPLFATTVLSLPTETPQSYECLASELSAVIRSSTSCVVVAESFSGPIAVKIASRYPASIAAVVLVASFVAAPIPAAARFLPWTLALRLPLPEMAARCLMVNADAPDDVVQILKRSIRQVPPKILAQRIRELTFLDVSEELSAVSCPIMYLRPLADRLVPKHCIDVIRQSKPEVHCQEINGPHLLLQCEPVRAWCAISEFLDGISAPGHKDHCR